MVDKRRQSDTTYQERALTIHEGGVRDATFDAHVNHKEMAGHRHDVRRRRSASTLASFETYAWTITEGAANDATFDAPARPWTRDQ